MRTHLIKRQTKETSIDLDLNLDGQGKLKANFNLDDEGLMLSGLGFFSHMLEQLVKNSKINLTLNVKGDVHIDSHHLVEDIGICLGVAFNKAIGDKKGIVRYATFYAPLDEALSRVVLDISGRSHLSFLAKFPSANIKNFDTELIQEFFIAFTSNAQITAHIDSLRGVNSHHIAESIFKSFGRALRTSISLDPSFKNDVPSTKGSL